VTIGHTSRSKYIETLARWVRSPGLMANEKRIVQKTAASVDAAHFRDAMSLLATGITIVSCGSGRRVRGMTCSSFTSVSLCPPTVLVSLSAGRTHELIDRSGWYGVSILNDNQQAYSAHFSGSGGTGLKPDFVVRDRVPTLRSSLAWFECEVTERIVVLDHTLFIGRVTACDSLPGSPLMYFARCYHETSLRRRRAPD
jgi:flavin reductase (DIM6/NTAB) family NADH-FMN oxidoreductase RutF